MWAPDFSSGDGPGLVDLWDLSVIGRAAIGFLPPAHRVGVPAKTVVPSRLAVDEAAAALLRDGPVTDGHSSEHSDDHVAALESWMRSWANAGTGCVCQVCASF